MIAAADTARKGQCSGLVHTLLIAWLASCPITHGLVAFPSQHHRSIPVGR